MNHPAPKHRLAWQRHSRTGYLRRIVRTPSPGRQNRTTSSSPSTAVMTASCSSSRKAWEPPGGSLPVTSAFVASPVTSMAIPATFASPSLLGWAWMAQRSSRLRSRTLTAFGIEPNDKSGPLNSTSEPLTRGEPSLRRVARMCVSAASNRARTIPASWLASLSNCAHAAMLSSLPADCGDSGRGALSPLARRSVPSASPGKAWSWAEEGFALAAADQEGEPLQVAARFAQAVGGVAGELCQGGGQAAWVLGQLACSGANQG